MLYIYILKNMYIYNKLAPRPLMVYDQGAEAKATAEHLPDSIHDPRPICRTPRRADQTDICKPGRSQKI